MTDSPYASLADVQAALLRAVGARLAPLTPEGVTLPPLTVDPPQPARGKKKVETGDLTIKLFALAKPLRTNPAKLAGSLAQGLLEDLPEVLSWARAAGGYLNMKLAPALYYALSVSDPLAQGASFGHSTTHAGQSVMVEYASPNTNKPLHLGHVRNVLLGATVSRLLAAVGYRVVQANLVNDRGIHICKSMLAYQEHGGGETPADTGEKGDHFVGRYYVRFATEEKKEEQAAAEGQAEKGALIGRAGDLLKRWEAGDEEVLALWKRMNSWVLAGFEQTFERLGVAFDRVDFESQTWTLGRSMVEEGLARQVLVQDEDGSVWLDMSDIGLDRKIFLRSDGTTVYITQDLGTAVKRIGETGVGGIVYVVGDEQEYHFRVLFEALRRMGYPWAQNLFHLSYGMVTLPGGRLKSREGRRVDADDLMDEVLEKERATLAELADKRAFALTPEEEEAIAMAALKFHILKFSPRKGFVFDPEESVQLAGDTGPYVQYVHTRVAGIARKAAERGIEPGTPDPTLLNSDDAAMQRLLLEFAPTVQRAARDRSPSHICGYLLTLSRAFSQWYELCPVLAEDGAPGLRDARLQLAEATALAIRNGLALLGIAAPTRM